MTSRFQHGFTLLELLIAVSLFALLGAMAYGGLNSVVRTQQALQQEGAELARWQFGFGLLQQDLLQAVARDIRDEQGDSRPSFLLGNDGLLLMAFTRAGQRDPLQRGRGSLQRVAYLLEEGRLYRQSWGHPDRARAEPDFRQQLLDDLEAVRLRLRDQEGKWHENWPPANQPQAAGLPTAVEMRFEREDQPPLQRLFRVGGDR